MLKPEIIAQIRAELRQARHGGKGHIRRKWAKTLGVSDRTVSRYAEGARPRKPRADKAKARIEGLDAAVDVVAAIKKKPPQAKGEIVTEDAIALAVDNGLIPEHFSQHSAAIQAGLRRKGYTKRERKMVRYQADRPNQMHHVDASGSDCLYVNRYVDGEPVLKLHKGHLFYKNKPIPTGLRPWIYGLVDDHSGVFCGKYYVAYGEDAHDNLHFLSWAWKKNDEKTFFGVPEKLKGDKGPMMRGKDANDFFERLNVAIDPSEPGNKEAHGKIERPWRTIWERFERVFFAEDMKTFEITLEELNRRFLIYQEEYNAKPHRWERDISRLQAWQRINHTGGAVDIAPEAVKTIVHKLERVVDSFGVFWLNNQAYEVKGFHAGRVVVWQSAFDADRVVVEDIKTGERYETKRFSPLKVGEFKAAPESPHQKAVKRSQELAIENTRHQVEKNEDVVMFPVKTKEVRAPENRLDLDAYAGVEEALADFCAQAGIFLEAGSAERSEVARLISEAALSREFVRELAAEITREAARQ